MQEKAWNDVKTLIASAPVLAYYKPTEVLEIQRDSSQSGLGAALMQNGHPIAYASRALTETESRYAQIEKEMLAIVFSVEKFNDFTFDRRTVFHTDHKPLESIFMKLLHRAPIKEVARNVDPFAKVQFGGTVREGKQNVLSRHSL